MLREIIEKVRVKLMLRDQMNNRELRRLFRDKYRVDVGMYSYGWFDQWRMPGPIRVGRYTSIANSVRCAPINHPLEALTTHPIMYRAAFGVVEQDIVYEDVLEIGDDVWIGHNTVILPGCKSIGRGAVIGAGAIVTKDVPPYTVVAGNPAKVLRERFAPDLVEALERIEATTARLAGHALRVRQEEDRVAHGTDLRRLVVTRQEPRTPERLASRRVGSA